jgi:hypothetical protein
VQKLCLLALAACSTPLVLQGSPSPPAPPPIHAEASLALPARGEVRSDVVSGGWPVWVIHHDDGRVSVLSGIAARARSGPTLFEPTAAIVRWFPHTRRLLGGDVVYDEHGHVLGYAQSTCTELCPRIAEPAPEERGLDTFDITLAPARIFTGALRKAPPGADPAWHDADRGEHVVTDIDPSPGELVPLATTIARALERPLGSYTVVRGSIVRTTVDEPHLCSASCTCTELSPRVLGVAAIAINKTAIDATPGTMLVRREPLGLVVVAMNHDGACR